MAKLTKSLKAIFAVCFIFVVCFVFAGCESSSSSSGASGMHYGSSSGSSGAPNLAEYLNDIVYTSLGTGEETGEHCYQMVTHLTDLIYTGLILEYGATAVVERDAEDTHKNARIQDIWLWQFDENNQDVVTEVKNYLQYNISCVLCGKEPLTVTPQEFATNQEYISLKGSGAFNHGADGGLRLIANKFYQTGYFYYEIDNIAEYILKNVIGEDVVAKDNIKFKDINNNGTFDYVENYGTSLTYNIISSYTLPYAQDRDEEIARNGVWARIEFNTASESPTVVDDVDTQGKDAKDIIVASQVTAERACLLTEISDDLNDYVSHHPEIVDAEAYLAQYKQQGISTNAYSGFKNYVNTIYYILYSSMYNFTYMDGENSVEINNVLTMTHAPNIHKDYIAPIDTIYNEETRSYSVPIKEYKSILLTTNSDNSIRNIWMTLYTDMEEPLVLDISLRYHFANDTSPIYREYIGTYDGEEHTVQANIMTVEVPANGYVQPMVDLTLTDEAIAEYKEKYGMNISPECVTDLARVGINNVLLRKYTPYIYPEHFVPKWWNLLEGYMALPNKAHLGSSFVYQNDYADFCEVVFDVRGTYTSQVRYGVGFTWTY